MHEFISILRHCDYSYGISERKACDVITLNRSTYRFKSVAPDQAVQRMGLRELAAATIRYGYKRLAEARAQPLIQNRRFLFKCAR